MIGKINNNVVNISQIKMINNKCELFDDLPERR